MRETAAGAGGNSHPGRESVFENRNHAEKVGMSSKHKERAAVPNSSSSE